MIWAQLAFKTFQTSNHQKLLSGWPGVTGVNHGCTRMSSDPSPSFSVSLPDLIPKVGTKLKSRWAPQTHLEEPRPPQVDIDRLNEKEMIANVRKLCNECHLIYFSLILRCGSPPMHYWYYSLLLLLGHLSLSKIPRRYGHDGRWTCMENTWDGLWWAHVGFCQCEYGRSSNRSLDKKAATQSDVCPIDSASSTLHY